MDSIFASSLSILEPEEHVQSEGVADRLAAGRERPNQTRPPLMVSGISANLLPILESIDEVKVKKEVEKEMKEEEKEKEEEEEEMMKNALPNDQVETLSVPQQQQQQQNSLSTVDGDVQHTIIVPAANAAAKRGRPPVARINDFETETDPVARRRAQNREAAHRYRERKKKEMAMLEEAAGISANLVPVPESTVEAKKEEEDTIKDELPNDKIETVSALHGEALVSIEGDGVKSAAVDSARPKRGRPRISEKETDPEKRKKAQKREAAHRYREKKKKRVEMLEEAAGISANSMPVLDSMVEEKKEEEDVIKDELPDDKIETVSALHRKALVSIEGDGVKSAAVDPAPPKRGRPRISEGITDSEKETDPEKRKKVQKREAAHRYREKKKKRVEMVIIEKMQERSAYLYGRVHELKTEIDHWKAKCAREFNFTPDSEFKMRRLLPSAAAPGTSIDGVAPGHAQSHTQHREDILLREETYLAVRRIPALRTALLTHYVEITQLRRQMGIDANVRTTADEAVLDMFRAVPPLSYCIQIP